jgi:trk system potassium uptake protein TrkA
MRIIIIGAGEVGYHIAKQLSEENQDVVLIDKDPKRIKRIGENLDVQTFWGSGTSPQMLRDAGIEDADMLVAATDSDEVNLIACLLARHLNRHMMKIARVKNREYLAEKDLFRKELLGIDLIINTRAMMVDMVMGLIEVPGASEVIDFVGGKVKLISFLISAESPFAGRRLSSLKGQEGNILVGAIIRGQKILIPSGRDTIQPHDLVYFVVRGTDVNRTLEDLKIRARPITNVIIVGAGETGMALAAALDEKRLHVKVIDEDPERCKQLATTFNHAIVIKGDGTDRDLLREENVGDTDLLIALTGDEESNILISLLAKGMGARRTITRVSKLSYIPVVSDIGLDTVINPRMAAVRAILQYIRKGKIISVAPLRDEHAEALEAEALETSDIVHTSLKDVKFPEGAILGAIVRGEDIIIPRGDTVILPQDRLIIFALQQVIPSLEKLLTVKLEYFA